MTSKLGDVQKHGRSLHAVQLPAPSSHISSGPHGFSVWVPQGQDTQRPINITVNRLKHKALHRHTSTRSVPRIKERPLLSKAVADTRVCACKPVTSSGMELMSGSIPARWLNQRKDEETFENRRLKGEAVRRAQQRGLCDIARYVAQCTS